MPLMGAEGIAMPVSEQSLRERVSLSSGARGLLFWLFAAVFFIYLFSAGSNFTSGDSYAELHVTASLLDHRWFDVPVQQQGQRCAGWGCRGSDGRFYASHGIGYSLALVPFYLAAEGAERLSAAPGCGDPLWRRCVPIQLTSWTTVPLSAATVALLCLFALEMGYALGSAVGVSLLYALASPAWPYARFGFDVTLTGLLLLAAVRCAWWAGSGSGPRIRLWLLAGLWSALAVAVRLPTLAALLPLPIWCWRASDSQSRRGRLLAMGAYCAPIGLALGWTAWYNAARFGSVFNDGHVGNAAEDLTRSPWTALAGLAISPGKGLVWYCPLVLLLLWSWPAFRRRHGARAWLVPAVILASLPPYIAVTDWYGGSAWGPRFLLPVLPLFFLALLPLPSLMSGRWRRRVPVAALVLLSAAVQLAGQMVSYPERLRIAQAGGYAGQLIWNVHHAPILDHLGTLITDLRHLEALRHAVPPADSSLDLWWLDLWRIHGVPAGPSMAAGALVGLCAIVAANGLRRRLLGAEAEGCTRPGPGSAPHGP
jgi:hypothetical protein